VATLIRHSRCGQTRPLSGEAEAAYLSTSLTHVHCYSCGPVGGSAFRVSEWRQVPAPVPAAEMRVPAESSR
jgi:hypothetical protein